MSTTGNLRMKNWRILPAEDITHYIPSRDKVTGKEIAIPVTRTKIRLQHRSGDEWVITCNPNGKFSLATPESKRAIEECGAFRPNNGFYRSGETKSIPNKDTGMSGKVLVQKLREKFGLDFTKAVASRLSKSGA